MEMNEKRIRINKKKMKLGYLMAIFCALLWALWYIPGNMLWTVDPFLTMNEEMIVEHGDLVGMLSVAILITALNAIACVLVLMIWCGYLRKLKEMVRTVKELKLCTKYYLLGALCGGPIAILGSFIASGTLGAAFAAVAAMVFPVVGSAVSATWLGQKLSRRAIAGILVILLGGITAYAGGIIEDLTSGDIELIGYVGGIMTALGWGLEGAVAAKGMDVSEPDVALTLRFIREAVLWWVIVVPVLIIIGVPVFDYAAQMLDPVLIVVLIMLGLTFGYCYVTWYKSFALIGVGRGQSLGTLCGLFSCVFLLIFCGQEQDWTLWLGIFVCVIGSFLLVSEDPSTMDSIRGPSEGE